MIRIIQYRDRCIGCFACVEANPDRWRISRSDGKSTLVDARQKGSAFTTTVPEFELEPNLRAEKNCPVNVIRIIR